MLDLETLGTSAGARILTIGACRFNPYTAEIGKLFHVAVDDPHGIVDTSTFAWWLKQSADAQRSMHEQLEQHKRSDCSPLAAIRLFDCFCEGDAETPRAEYLWSNGPAFDEAILREFYRRYWMADSWPIRPSKGRCFRTLCELAGPELVRVESETAHDALSDAIAQARTVAAAYRLLLKINR
jgi:hypothetical protein